MLRRRGAMEVANGKRMLRPEECHHEQHDQQRLAHEMEMTMLRAGGSRATLREEMAPRTQPTTTRWIAQTPSDVACVSLGSSACLAGSAEVESFHRKCSVL